MFCKNCGKQIDDSSRFCKYCGSNVLDENNSLTSDEPEKKVEKFKQSRSSCIKWLIGYSLWFTFCIIGTCHDLGERSNPIHPIIPFIVLGFIVPFIIWGIWYLIQTKKNNKG